MIPVMFVRPFCSILIFMILFNKRIKGDVYDNTINQCNLSQNLKKEIANYETIVNRIIKTALDGSFRNETYVQLAKFVDKFGNRLAGTDNLEKAIDYMMDLSKSRGLENVHGEPVTVRYWRRGGEAATLLLGPKNTSLHILGLGYSVGTPPGGITARVLVVRSFDELRAKAAQAKGRIVVYNQEFTGYGPSVQYRSRGAAEAAKVGAVASLVRSVTDFSLNTPHTGMQRYGDDAPAIPAACISVEDADMLERVQDRGDAARIHLEMGDATVGERVSRNTVAEIVGSAAPEKVVVVSGHLDSWDVGAGAMDDGGGVFISWGALALLNSLDLRPKRTLRAVYWTAEEQGYVGAYAYAKRHRNETDNFNFLLESDIGTFNPLGIEYAAGREGGCILQEIMRLLSPINATQTKLSNDVGSDIMVWYDQNVPLGSLLNDNKRYFWYHHTDADTMDVEDPVALDKSTALWASVAYVLADLSVDFPRATKEEMRSFKKKRRNFNAK